MTASPRPIGRRALWAAIGLVLLAGVAFSWNPTPLAQALAGVFIACALVHASATYGLRAALALFAICLAVTFTMENIGTSTGFPFGRYHFVVGAELPQVGRIPIIVGPLWFGSGYFAWVVAATMLDGADRALDRRVNLVALPLVAAFVLAQWDLVTDAPAATIAKAWIWHDGGGMFGVPIANYLGWLLTGWLFFCGFALYLRRRERADGARGPSRELRLIAILFYVGAGLTHLVPLVFADALQQTGTVTDAAGAAWRVHDIREATVTVFIFTMLFSGLFAALQLARGNVTPAAAAPDRDRPAART